MMMTEIHHVDLVSSDVNCSTNSKVQENVTKTVKENVLNSEPYFEANKLDIKQVVCGMNNCFILMQDGKVFGDLKNSLFEVVSLESGDVAVAEQDKCPSKNICHWRHARWFTDKKIKQIACGYYHMVLISSENIIYYFPFNTPKINMRRWTKAEYKQLESFKTVVCGAYHSILLTNESKGNCYGWHNFQSSELPELPCTTPLNARKPLFQLNHPILMNEHIVQVAAGYRMTLFLNDKGDLFSCGNNKNGALFLGYKSDFEPLQKVNTLPGPVKKVWCGYQHAMVQLVDNRYFICGSAADSQFAFVPISEIDIVQPMEVMLPALSSFIRLSGLSTCFVTPDEQLYVYGPKHRGKIELSNAAESTMRAPQSTINFICGIFQEQIYYGPMEREEQSIFNNSLEMHLNDKKFSDVDILCQNRDC
jgi:alpha-tubulin suppressor-like RCC1 family protein